MANNSNVIPIGEFISKYKNQYGIVDEDYDNSFTLKNGTTLRSKNIYYVKGSKSFNVNVNNLIILNGQYDKLNVLCKTDNEKNIMAFVISVLEKYKDIENNEYKIRDFKDENSFDFFPYQINCNFEEAYGLTVNFNDIYNNSPNKQYTKDILATFFEILFQSKNEYKLEVHSITNNEKINIRYILNIKSKASVIDYTNVDLTPFQYLIRELNDPIILEQIYLLCKKGKNPALFPFLLIKREYLEELCVLLNEDYKIVNEYLKCKSGGTEWDFRNFKTDKYYQSNQTDRYY